MFDAAVAAAEGGDVVGCLKLSLSHTHSLCLSVTHTDTRTCSAACTSRGSGTRRNAISAAAGSPPLVSSTTLSSVTGTTCVHTGDVALMSVVALALPRARGVGVRGVTALGQPATRWFYDRVLSLRAATVVQKRLSFDMLQLSGPFRTPGHVIRHLHPFQSCGRVWYRLDRCT